MTVEGDFHAEMLRLYREAKQEGYTPSYFLRMVNEMGGLAAAKKLIGDERPSEGFTRLWEMGRLDLTVESVALEPRYRELFSPEQLRRARQRLREYRRGSA